MQKKPMNRELVEVVVDSSHNIVDDFDDDEGPNCRICLEVDELNQLCSPCACHGSIKYAHLQCLKRWCVEKKSLVCEICGQEYRSPELVRAVNESLTQAVDDDEARIAHAIAEFDHLDRLPSGVVVAQFRRLLMFSMVFMFTVVVFHVLTVLLVSSKQSQQGSHGMHKDLNMTFAGTFSAETTPLNHTYGNHSSRMWGMDRMRTDHHSDMQQRERESSSAMFSRFVRGLMFFYVIRMIMHWNQANQDRLMQMHR